MNTPTATKTLAHVVPPVVSAEHPWTLFAPVVRPGIDVVLEDLVTHAGQAGRDLPPAIDDALLAFADAPHRSGALLLKGVEVGQLPSTPATPTTPAVKDLTSEFALLTVARRLGQPVGYAPELGGAIVQNIVPVQASATRQVSTSSRVELMFHTEAAFHPHRPRYLLLLCLKGDPSATTTLASIREVVPMLDPRVVEVLRQPRFRTSPDESYLSDSARALGKGSLGEPMAVITGSDDEPRLVFDADLMIGTDAEADAALLVLAAAVASFHTGVVLEAGDLLIIDNTIAVHGRSPFTPRFDGTDRWLQRTFVVSDLAPSAHERTGRVITTQFS